MAVIGGQLCPEAVGRILDAQEGPDARAGCFQSLHRGFEFGVVEYYLAFGEIDDMDQFGRRRPGVERNPDEPCAEHAQEALERSPRIRTEQRRLGTRRNTPIAKRQRNCMLGCLDLSIGPIYIAIDKTIPER